MIKRHLFPILFLACLALAFFAYFPGLNGYFLFDDTINIVENQNLRITALNWLTLKQAAFSGNAGMLGRPISMASFGLDYFANGLDPYYFKLTNLFIHLLNGICVFALSNLLLQAHRRRQPQAVSHTAAKWLSLALAAAWLLHPLNMSSVLYIVQRMTSLSTLFTLLGLIVYVYGRLQLNDEGNTRKSGWAWIAAGFVVFLPLAIFSKENGALLPVFLMLVELIFFNFKTPSTRARLLLTGAFILTVILPLIAVLIFTAVHPEWLGNTYKIRDFTLSERLMTEARILWFYVRLVLVPDISALGMYHDDIHLSTGLMQPMTTLPACAGIFLVTVLAVMSIKRYPIAAFGILFFLLGHSMESSVIPLELAHEHRNYLPMFGLLFVLFYYLLAAGRHNESARIRGLIAVSVILLLAGVSFLRANQWGDAVEQKLKEVAHHPNSLRSNMEVGAFYAALPASNQIEADEFYNNAYKYYAKASSLSPTDTLGLLGLIALNSRASIPLEDSWTSVLAKRIENNPFTPNTGNSMVKLYKCVASDNCKNAAISMEILFQAAFRNPTLRGATKVQLLFAWSDFLADVKHRPEAAVAAARQAAALDASNVESQINLITILINQGRTAEAKTAIDRTRGLDNKGLYVARLNDLEKLTAKE